MDYEKVSASILGAIERRRTDVEAYRDLFGLCQSWAETDFQAAHRMNKRLRDMCNTEMNRNGTDILTMSAFHEQWRLSLLFEAPHDFDSFLQYMELNREAKKRFYQPRRKVLKTVVDDLQALCVDDKLDLLAVSLPPGSGKTTLALFFLAFLAGREPNSPILTGSHSNAFIRGCYDEVLRLVDPQGEYLWHDVFPGIAVSGTNAKDCRIDFDKRQRFETLEFTSIGTGNAGLYRAATLLYCDDLVSGIEVALSKERLDKLWETYTTDLRQRKIGDHCKELHIATRWSVHDVIGRLEREYEKNDRAKFIRIPAMDENDESNFDYQYGVGFSTKFYREQREIMDSVSWKALYMNQPIEREGLVYHPDELRRFFELPQEEPDAIIGVCDTKDKGNDYAFLPVGYVYGQDYYIADCVCDNGLPDTVDARLTDILVRDKVKACRFESNSAGRRVAEKIQGEVKRLGGVTNITTKFTTANKETKIIVNSAWVKEHCLFLDESKYKRNTDYGRMMDMLCSYTVAGKNKHDDVPDGMAMFAEYAQSLNGGSVEVFARPF
jgi:predicted phage terminase large subunit-like protein